MHAKSVTVLVMAALLVGGAVGMALSRFLATPASKPVVGWCRELTEAEFYQSSTDRMRMWAEGAEVQTDEASLQHQLRQVGYRVYIPLCERSLARVRSELRQKGLKEEAFEPWTAEMHARLKRGAR
jgi:hypothetical protein